MSEPTTVSLIAENHRLLKEFYQANKERAQFEAELEAVKEKLKLNRSTQRCGECGNVGMFMTGIEMADKLDRLTQANEILRKGLEKYIAICEKLVDKSEKDKLILKPSGADELATVAREALAEADKLESESGE